jgi:ABC-2 type transport system ATP-binding protein
MELMCDRVGIIAKGKMIGTYSMEELTTRSQGDFAEYIIETDSPKNALDSISLPAECKACEDSLIKVKVLAEIEKEAIAKVNSEIIKSGFKLYSVHKTENKKLEDVFIELTDSKEGDGQIG